MWSQHFFLVLTQAAKGPCTRAQKSAGKTSRGKKTYSHTSAKNKNSDLFPRLDSE